MSPQDVIEYAEATGDDLNLIPESFRPAVEARTRGKFQSHRTVPQPPRGLDDRLTRSAPKPGLGLGVSEDWITPFSGKLARSATAPHIPLHPRASMSMESLASASSFGQSNPCNHRRLASSDNDDLEARHPSRPSRAHPPIAPSAHFESRRSRRTSDVNNSSDSDVAAIARLPQQRDVSTSIPLVNMESRGSPATTSWSRQPFDDYAAWQSFSFPAIHPCESVEVLVELPAERSSPDPFHRSVTGTIASPNTVPDPQHIRTPQTVQAPTTPPRQSLAPTESSTASLSKSSKKTRKVQKKSRTPP